MKVGTIENGRDFLEVHLSILGMETVNLNGIQVSRKFNYFGFRGKLCHTLHSGIENNGPSLKVITNLGMFKNSPGIYLTTQGKTRELRIQNYWVLDIQFILFTMWLYAVGFYLFFIKFDEIINI